ncbi:flavin reductase family protein [Acidothermaceae bacterium B102]|nr:flavin reductase family protein [Acidothermaceae bacterium B102]
MTADVAAVPVVFDPARLRHVFGAFPTGVTALAGLVDGEPVGLTANSFTSVSLDPALVSVCVAVTSSTWSVLQTARRLGISILAADQEAVGRQLAAKTPDRFAGLSWRATTDGAVLLDGATGWLETSVSQVVRAGDHDIVVLEVHDLHADHDVSPLVFHASRYHELPPADVSRPTAR